MRIAGVLIYWSSFLYGENISVTYNNQRPGYTLSKNSNLIFYNEIRESVAVGESLMTHIPTNYNPLDLMMKVLTGQKRRNHVGNIMYDIYDEHHYY